MWEIVPRLFVNITPFCVMGLDIWILASLWVLITALYVYQGQVHSQF